MRKETTRFKVKGSKIRVSDLHKKSVTLINEVEVLWQVKFVTRVNNQQMHIPHKQNSLVWGFFTMNEGEFESIETSILR
jgi:hypothetical protein